MEFPAFEWIRRTAYFLHSGDYYMEKHSPASKLSRALSGVAGKEGQLATTSLELEFHPQCPCGSPSTKLSDFRQLARSGNECECEQTLKNKCQG